MLQKSAYENVIKCFAHLYQTQYYLQLASPLLTHISALRVRRETVCMLGVCQQVPQWTWPVVSTGRIRARYYHVQNLLPPLPVV